MTTPPSSSATYSLENRSLLITGGSGTFGWYFASHLLKHHKLARVIIFSRGEMRQFEMQQSDDFRDARNVRFFIGDVRDVNRLEMAMRGVDVVVHAAALKQVPTAEYNPMECIHTNVTGAENVVQAALRSGVSRVVALSTDKAVNPINLYGASKLASDKIFIAANALAGQDGTRFSVVRYGNVIGSRGSVIPFFQGLIDQGAKELPITDPRMTRFLMTVDQSAQLVVSSLRAMKGGEVFIPKIPSAKIVDVAKWMAPNLPHKMIGIRPGEKLHEVLITSDFARTCLDCGEYYLLRPEFAFWGDTSEIAHAGKPVPEDFVYSSDINDRWLKREEFLKLLGKTP